MRQHRSDGAGHHTEIDVLDFFCGCGGASLGFRDARTGRTKYRLIGGVDLDPHALATYARNLGVPALSVDINSLSNRSAILRMMNGTRRDPRNPLVLIGCAPCQGFSSHTKMDGDDDPRRTLIERFAQIATELKPDAILIENVPELFADRNWPHFKTARDRLRKSGYNVRARIYNFAEFGLPQERFRAVVMALKKPFEMPVPFLAPEGFRTVRETISHLPPLNAGECDPHDPMHVTSRHRKSTIELLSKVPKDGGNRPPGVGPKCLDRARGAFGGYTDVYGRLAWNRPALTITARCRTPSCGRYAHPEQDRGLSVREAALLQGFPPDFYIEGPFDDKFKQIGNAVPPSIAKLLAEHMYNQLLTEESRQNKERDGTDVVSSIGPGFSILINGIKRRRDRIAQTGTYGD
jgi:DNA (cytosine-5)-methyltransferase 1